MGTESESLILAKILRDVSGGAVRLFRNQVGKYQVNDRWISYGLHPGSSDIIGTKSVVITPDMVGKTVCLFVAIEVKKHDGVVKPHQQRFIDFISKSGGLAGVARSPEDARKILQIPA